MKYASLLSLFALAILASTVGQASEEKKVRFFCPVVGFPDSKACCCPSFYCGFTPKVGLTLDYKGAKLQFCCGKCVKIFKDAPAKYASAANHQLVATKQANQTKCPNCGSEPGYVTPVDVGGIPVSFCFECWQTANATKGDARINMVFSDKAFARGFVMNVQKK